MGLFSLDLAWVASGRRQSGDAAHGDGLPRLDLGLAHPRRSRRPRHRRRPLHRALVRRRADLGAEGPQARASSPPATCCRRAFMTGASLVVAGLQSQGVGLGTLFLVLGLAQYRRVRAGVARLGPRRRAGSRRVSSSRRSWGSRSRAARTCPRRATRAIIAPNHVSLLDASMMHAILPSHAAFAIDTGMANTWWVKPFLKLVKAEAIDPDQAARHAQPDQRGQGRRDAGHLPRGSPHRDRRPDEGLRRHRDDRRQGRRRGRAGAHRRPRALAVRLSQPLSDASKAWFPKTTITILPPVKLDIDPALKGRARRQAAGAKLQDIMVDSAVHDRQSRTARCFRRWSMRGETRDTGKPAVEDPLGTKLSYSKLITARRCSAPSSPARARGRQRRRDAAELGRRGGDVLCAADRSAACRRCSTSRRARPT